MICLRDKASLAELKCVNVISWDLEVVFCSKMGKDPVLCLTYKIALSQCTVLVVSKWDLGFCE